MEVANFKRLDEVGTPKNGASGICYTVNGTFRAFIYLGAFLSTTGEHLSVTCYSTIGNEFKQFGEGNNDTRN